MARNNKKVISTEKPSNKKQPRLKENPDNNNSLSLSWQFNLIDIDCPWCFKQISDDYFWSYLFCKLKFIESRTWGEIIGDCENNHYIPKNEIIKEASKRLEIRKLDDNDELFTLRLDGKKRIWGIRDGRVFKIIWWDREHLICPSRKKNT